MSSVIHLKGYNGKKEDIHLDSEEELKNMTVKDFIRRVHPEHQCKSNSSVSHVWFCDLFKHNIISIICEVDALKVADLSKVGRFFTDSLRICLSAVFTVMNVFCPLRRTADFEEN